MEEKNLEMRDLLGDDAEAIVSLGSDCARSRSDARVPCVHGEQHSDHVRRTTVGPRIPIEIGQEMVSHPSHETKRRPTNERTEIAQKELAHNYLWNREGHPYAILREQAQTKLKDRRTKTECLTTPPTVE